MVDASELIAGLDEALAAAGEDVILRRVTAGLNIDLPCRATVRTYRLREEELSGGIAQAVDVAVLSPSEIARAQWPGGELPSLTVAHPNYPRRGDQLIVQGRVREIGAVSPISVGSTVVRFDLQLRG